MEQPRYRGGLNREQIGFRTSKELKEGYYINIGLGMANEALKFLSDEQEIFLQGENGIIGYWKIPENEADRDPGLVNPSGLPVSLKPGAAFTDTMVSFGIMRAKHLDLALMGAFQVSEKGDIANWALPNKIGGIGGAMDLATGAKRVIVVMWHTESDGRPKILKKCTYPLTAIRAINQIFTNLAIISITDKGLVLEEIAPGYSFEEVQSYTEPRLIKSDTLREILLN
ncbi:MAG: CoA-transferase [Chloroflexota bacterium]